MTTLEQAFAEAAKLPIVEQEAIAAWLLAELASERRWNSLFSQSSDQLNTLADEALAEWQAGKTKPLDPEQL
jgi:hypothetical protein